MFLKAKPVWIAGKAEEMNIQAAIRTRVAACDALCLHITGTAFYRLYVNGSFVASGPARGPEGYLREDVIGLSYPEGEMLAIEIEAMGYYCGRLAAVRAPSCIMAELRQGDQVLQYTGRDFEGFLPGTHLQKVERYSVQRHFSEVWDFRENREVPAPLEVAKERYNILPRVAPYPLYEELAVKTVHRVGNFQFDETLPYKENKYSWRSVPKEWGVFEKDEVVSRPCKWLQRQKQTVTGKDQPLPLTLEEGQYAILDFGRIEAGFLKMEVESLLESNVVVGFTELYLGEEFQFTQMNAQNVLEYFLPAGDHRTHQCFEPYTFRYAIVMVKSGSIRLDGFGAVTYMTDTRNVPELPYENETQAAIGRAAVRNFAHNALDFYMDCPSRERAGWLADGYFTSQAEYAMTGKTQIEDAFLENYRMFPNLRGEIPQGALPETYPSDIVPGGTFIPQFNLWYILEVEKYVFQRGNLEKKEAFRDSIYGVLEFFHGYENSDGLIENLPSWNFIEWSGANDWCQDVNYPTNFLYAAALEAAYHLFGDERHKARSQEVRKETVRQSFNGKYFLDHSIRDENGNLQLQDHASEVCQYYALLFGGIDSKAPEYAFLMHLITDVFALDRKGAMPEIIEINVFPGLFLRMDALMKLGEYDLVLTTVEDFFGKMEPYTGTLWEYRQFKGSYDHGFSSIAYAVMKEAFEKKA